MSSAQPVHSESKVQAVLSGKFYFSDPRIKKLIKEGQKHEQF